MNNIAELDFKQHGVEIVENFVESQKLDEIKSELELMNYDDSQGIRNAEKKVPVIRDLVSSKVVLDKAKCYLKENFRLIRVILFNKAINRNWLVTWHQDKAIAVNQRVDMINWGPWSVKDGVHHVQPPADILQQVVTLRVHLDDADESNGCLKVIPGSHEKGILSSKQVQALVSQQNSIPCCVKAGDLLVMRPLLLHASSKTINATNRSVIHIEFSDAILPDGINFLD